MLRHLHYMAGMRAPRRGFASRLPSMGQSTRREAARLVDFGPAIGPPPLLE
jgi:hypothetical protein